MNSRTAISMFVLFAGCGGEGGEELVFEDGTSRPLPPATGASFGALAGNWDLAFSRVMYRGTTSGSLAVTGRSATFSSGSPCPVNWERDSGVQCNYFASKVDLSLDGNRIVGDYRYEETDYCADRCTTYCEHLCYPGTSSIGFSAVRKSRAQSVFGDLGGTWEVTWADWRGRQATCTISAIGDRIETDCTNGYLISATISSGMLSGNDTYGSEFSGRRR